jgi:hypothetical protein
MKVIKKKVYFNQPTTTEQLKEKVQDEILISFIIMRKISTYSEEFQF